jgi:hypothetical protein
MRDFEWLISGILYSHSWLNQANTMNILKLALEFCVKSLYRSVIWENECQASDFSKKMLSKASQSFHTGLFI